MTDGEDLGETGTHLMRMALGTAGKQRVLQGQLEHVILIPATHPIAKALHDEGVKYKAQATANKNHGFGPPHIAKAAKLLELICQMEVPTLQPFLNTLNDWRLEIESGDLTDALEVLRQCWDNPAYQQPDKEKQVRIIWNFEGVLTVQTAAGPRNFTINQIIAKLLRTIPNSVPKAGAPPPMTSERKVRQALRSLLAT